MVRSASLFSQLLQHVPRLEFAPRTQRHRTERGAKGFTCWSQLIAMLFCHLARADSLRETCSGLSWCLRKLNHLRLRAAPKRSTLPYANSHRPAALHEQLFWTLAERL